MDSTTKLQLPSEESFAMDEDSCSFPPIPVSIFPAHVERKHDKENQGFSKDYHVSTLLFHLYSHFFLSNNSVGNVENAPTFQIYFFKLAYSRKLTQAGCWSMYLYWE